jgi:hypothetical protein
MTPTTGVAELKESKHAKKSMELKKGVLRLKGKQLVI